MPDLDCINNTLGKMAHYLNNHEGIVVSVSGGSDSDILVHLASKFPQYADKVRYVFMDTGLEWPATRAHLDYLEERYGIKIDRIRGMSVVTAVRTYGVPVISKDHSDTIARFCNGTQAAYNKVMYKTGKYGFTEKMRNMTPAIRDRGIKVSYLCCNKSKKEPFVKYAKEHGVDLSITGERKAEGVVRATKHVSCFERSVKHGYDKFMPLFFWDDELKAWYKEHEGLRYSDCYEVYGLRRTGCVGCPFDSRVGLQLKLMKLYQPNLYKACINVFGESYRLMDEFGIRKVKILDDEQLSLFEKGEEKNG